MSSWDLSAPQPKKVENGVEKELESSFSTPFWTFWAPLLRGPGAHFGLFFQIWARRPPMTLQQVHKIPSLKATMLGANLSDQIPGGLNLTLTLTLNSN